MRFRSGFRFFVGSTTREAVQKYQGLGTFFAVDGTLVDLPVLEVIVGEKNAVLLVHFAQGFGNLFNDSVPEAFAMPEIFVA